MKEKRENFVKKCKNAAHTTKCKAVNEEFNFKNNSSSEKKRVKNMNFKEIQRWISTHFKLLIKLINKSLQL